jgi:hypothetical protein
MTSAGDDGWEGGSVGSDYDTLRKSRSARPTVLGAARLCFKWAYTPARLSAALGLALLAITSLWLALAQEKRRAACWQDSIPAFVGTLRPATLTHFALSRGRGSTLDSPPSCYSHCEQVFCTAGKAVADARIEDVEESPTR